MADYRSLPRFTNDNPIARARIAAGMTQGQLADAIGCLQKDISRWERGKHSPNIVTLAAIAKALGCPMETLL